MIDIMLPRKPNICHVRDINFTLKGEVAVTVGVCNSREAHLKYPLTTTSGAPHGYCTYFMQDEFNP